MGVVDDEEDLRERAPSRMAPAESCRRKGSTSGLVFLVSEWVCGLWAGGVLPLGEGTSSASPCLAQLCTFTHTEVCFLGSSMTTELHKRMAVTLDLARSSKERLVGWEPLGLGKQVQPFL